MYYQDFKGSKISALGMGGLRFPCIPGTETIDTEKAGKLIQACMEGGINYYDTAYTYQNGESERILGKLLSCYARDRYYLATKFYAASGLPIDQVFQEQLERLRTDYFDFYLLHSMDENFIRAYMNPKNGYLEFLLKQKEAGKIRYLGFSSHAAPETLEKFLSWHDGFDMALIQLNYLDWTVLDAKRQYEILTEHGIPVWVMEPLKGGLLSSLNAQARRILRKVAPDRSVSSWGFRFLMGLPNVYTILSGMSSLEQLEDNLETFRQRRPLGGDELETLREAADTYLNAMGVPCSACRYCVPHCPSGLDIPVLIRAYNEKRISGEFWKVAAAEQTKGPENCIRCGACRRHCPQKIDIPAIMRDMAKGTKCQNPQDTVGCGLEHRLAE